VDSGPEQTLDSSSSSSSRCGRRDNMDGVVKRLVDSGTWNSTVVQTVLHFSLDRVRGDNMWTVQASKTARGDNVDSVVQNKQ
jgi:hypothetical protein